MSPEERTDVQHLYGTLYHADPMTWPKHIASALAQARAEAFAEALRAVSTLDGYSAELERAHAAIREKAKP